jgi:hypothetical protein
MIDSTKNEIKKENVAVAFYLYVLAYSGQPATIPVVSTLTMGFWGPPLTEFVAEASLNSAEAHVHLEITLSMRAH